MRLTRTLAAAVLLAAGFFALQACSTDPGLAASRSERLATVAVPGTTSGSSTESKGGTALGKPLTAGITRRLPLATGASGSSVTTSLDTLATGDGWTPVATVSEVRRYTKDVAGQHLQLDAAMDFQAPQRLISIIVTSASPPS